MKKCIKSLSIFVFKTNKNTGACSKLLDEVRMVWVGKPALLSLRPVSKNQKKKRNYKYEIPNHNSKNPVYVITLNHKQGFSV